MEQTTTSVQINQLEQLLSDSIRALSETIETFRDNQFNRIPFKGSWTAAQVSEHVIKSLELIHQMVNGDVRATERYPRQYIVELKEMMENLEIKAQSAPNLLPGEAPMHKLAIQDRLLQCLERLIQSIHHLDLYATCVVAEFPGIGYLTRYELFSFAAFHTRRHIHQMKNIDNILADREN